MSKKAMAAVESAELVAELERTVRASLTRSSKMLRTAADLLSVTAAEAGR